MQLWGITLKVGIISFSITRLKLGLDGFHRWIIQGVRWNYKFLDYEIETPFICAVRETHRAGLGWNHKFLDYEIETYNKLLHYG